MCSKEEIYKRKINIPQVDTSIETTTCDDNFKCKLGDGFWFYDNLEVEDKPLIYEYLLSSAQYKVYVWDKYINKGDEELFKLINIHNNMKVRLLTSCKDHISIQEFQDYKRDFIDVLKSMNREIIEVELKVYHESKNKKGFHDRYLFIDEDIYFVGSSMTTHNTKNKSIPSSTSIYKIDNDINKDIIERMFLKYWDNSEIIELD